MCVGVLYAAPRTHCVGCKIQTKMRSVENGKTFWKLFEKQPHREKERVCTERSCALSTQHTLLYAIFENTFSKLRAAKRVRESERAIAPCRVRNVKVHCFIEENGEKLFGRADAKLSNSWARWENSSVFRNEQEAEQRKMLPGCIKILF